MNASPANTLYIPTETQAVLRVLSPGMHSSMQDRGRSGLKKWGVPRSGAMDGRTYLAVNHILGNPRDAAVLEILLGNVRFECLADTWIVLGGAGQAYLNGRALRCLRTERLHKGDVLFIPLPSQRVWTYLAVEGGWSGDSWLGSRSVWPAAGMGRLLAAHDVLHRYCDYALHMPAGVAARYMGSSQAHSDQPVDFAVWRGPQWSQFSDAARAAFLHHTWQVSPRSNRAGYRLEGIVVESPRQQMLSEPAIRGSIQIPADGKPIVLLNDGPTIGGYPKLALIDETQLDSFCQLAPGQHLTFTLRNA